MTASLVSLLLHDASQGHFYSFHLSSTNTLYVFPESNTLNLPERREIMGMICVPVMAWDVGDCSFSSAALYWWSDFSSSKGEQELDPNKGFKIKRFL